MTKAANDGVDGRFLSEFGQLHLSPPPLFLHVQDS
jgi:hypothetical protein